MAELRNKLKEKARRLGYHFESQNEWKIIADALLCPTLGRKL